MNAHDYVWIAAWGREMGSDTSYVRGEQQKAAADNAPLTAIHRDDHGWHTVEDVTNSMMLARLRSLASTLGIADTSPIDIAEARVAQMRPGWHLADASKALLAAAEAAAAVGDTETAEGARDMLRQLANVVDLRLQTVTH